MPRYLFETPASGDAALEKAIALAARHYPEVAVEHQFSAHDEVTERCVWVCRAPSETHLRRWATAASLPLTSVQHVAADTPARSID